DFNYTEQLSADQLDEIALIANQAVDSDLAVNTIETSLEEAKAMGAMALFGENYGNNVRVVEIGGPFSIELCGGTHVAHSSQIGPVSALGESSVGSGARRIEAYSGMDAFNYYSKEAALVDAVSKDLKVPSDDLPCRIAALTDKLKQPEQEIAKLHQAQLQAKSPEFVAVAQDINGFKVLILELPQGVPVGDLRTREIDLRNRMQNEDEIIVLSAASGSKLPFID